MDGDDKKLSGAHGLVVKCYNSHDEKDFWALK